MLHVSEAVTIGALTKMNAFVGGVVLETPLTLFNPSFFVVPSISEGVGSALSLWSFFLRNLSGDIVDDWRGNVVIGVGCP